LAQKGLDNLLPLWGKFYTTQRQGWVGKGIWGLRKGDTGNPEIGGGNNQFGYGKCPQISLWRPLSDSGPVLARLNFPRTKMGPVAKLAQIFPEIARKHFPFPKFGERFPIAFSQIPCKVGALGGF